MSCTTIELNRKAVTGLEEIGKKIQVSMTLMRMGFEVTDGEDSSAYQEQAMKEDPTDVREECSVHSFSLTKFQ